MSSIDTSEFYGEKNKFLHHVLGDKLIAEYNVCYIGQEGQTKDSTYQTPLYYYNSEIQQYNEFISVIGRVVRAVIPDLKETQVREVRKYIENKAPIKRECGYSIIGMKNCIVDVLTGEQFPKGPDMVVRRFIPVNYNPTITSHKDVEQFFNTLFADNWTMIQPLIYEMLGYPLLGSNKYGKIFMLVGEGGNGKSSFIDLIRLVLGASNCSSVALSSIDERFQNVGLFGKMANLGDDIESGEDEKAIQKSANLKKIATGEPIELERKGTQPFEWLPTVKLFFSANTPPKIKDKSKGMKDRLLVIPFLERIRYSNVDDPDIMDKLNDDKALSYVFNKSMEGLQRLVKNGTFTIPEYVQAFTEKYHKENSYVYQFIEDVNSGDIKDMGFAYSSIEFTFKNGVINGGQCIEDFSRQALYELYRRWCGENGHKYILSNPKFKEEMAQYGYEPKQIRNGIHRGFKHYRGTENEGNTKEPIE